MFNISVVIPAYNEAPRIERAIRSVLNQTDPVNEIIVVDDGSTDGTSKVVENFSNSVTCVKQTNQGLAAARNTGIRFAQNEWIAFLDADDEWLPEHIEKARKLLSQHPDIVWLCAAFERRSEDGTLLRSGQMTESLLQNGIIENYFIAQAKTHFSLPSSMIIKKSVLIISGWFNNRIGQYGEDLDIWFRVALRYPKIAYLQSVGCIYWCRVGSLTTERNVNIPRYLRRIEITLSSKSEIHSSCDKGSNFLIQTWIIRAVKEAIKQKDIQSLSMIKQKFVDFLPWYWKVVRWIFQNSVAMEIAQFGLKVRSFMLR